MTIFSTVIRSGLAVFLSCWFIFSANAQPGRFKRVDYTYDLVSNKVTNVSYEKDSLDQFIHKYSYDADNRITEVHTSTDGVIWDRDAAYRFYQHGPLARVELGDNKVQGNDYVYTLQGWIKGVNSNTLDPARDAGKDGLNIPTGSGGGRVARDAYGFSLGYYRGDYKPIAPLAASSNFIADITGSALDADNTSLYNGNIRHMVTALGQLQPNGSPLQVQASVYRYDQLNRLNQTTVYGLPANTNSWAGATANGNYNETFTYDANGNIQNLLRKGIQNQTMDELAYNYTSSGGKKINNKLLQVNDNVGSNLYTIDIDDQGVFSDKDASTQNYGYDELGNLIRDKQEGIANIEWTAAGKVRKITRVGGSTMPDLEFDYDGMGHRILKIEKPAGQSSSAWISTYYVHDATGNVLAIYKKSNSSIVLQEQSIYGASRLGTITRNVDMASTSPSLTNYQRTLGKKQYELSNHLGNVLSTVSDRKLQHNNGGTVDYYTADILSATDYYAFGSPMPGRDFSSDNYRFGFNGMEKDNEVKGSGNSYTTEFRDYDPRLGRWTSVDPKVSKYPQHTPYNAFNNNPVLLTDVSGADPANNTNDEGKKTSSTNSEPTKIDLSLPLGDPEGLGPLNSKLNPVPPILPPSSTSSSSSTSSASPASLSDPLGSLPDDLEKIKKLDLKLPSILPVPESVVTFNLLPTQGYELKLPGFSISYPISKIDFDPVSGELPTISLINLPNITFGPKGIEVSTEVFEKEQSTAIGPVTDRGVMVLVTVNLGVLFGSPGKSEDSKESPFLSTGAKLLTGKLGGQDMEEFRNASPK